MQPHSPPAGLVRYLFIGSLALMPMRVGAIDESNSLGLIVRTVQNTPDTATRQALLTGMLRGLEGRRNVPAPGNWRALSSELRTGDDAKLRDLANRLSQIFGDKEAKARALAALRDTSNDIDSRRAALKSLVSQKAEELRGELTALTDVPGLSLDAIRAFGVIAVEEAPKILLARYPEFNEQQQRAVVETLATRKSYAKSLVAAIKSKRVPRQAIPSYMARSLRDMMGDSFTEAYGEIPEMQSDVKALLAKYKKLITPKKLAAADPARGRAVYEKTCAACHLMYGAGGKIGPDLTGSNRANLDYLLLNSLAPSADVPKGYRMVIVETIDGRVLTGVLAEENNQRLILKTVDQPEVVIAKDDIENRKVSDKSMMPEGQLQQMTNQQIFDLVRYMQSTQQVELAE